jgi:hypothetical protein
MDRLLRDVFAMLMDEKWKFGTEAAVDATLVGRYYERFADLRSWSPAGSCIWSQASSPAKPIGTTSRREAARRPWLATGWASRLRYWGRPN